jgi:hypothetical protein
MKKQDNNLFLLPSLNRVYKDLRHIHLMGICGTGMASLAGFLKEDAKMGSSIKGLVKRKNTSPLKKLSFFLDSKLPTSTALFNPPIRARYFSLLGSRSAYADPHQSSIGIKAVCLRQNA